MNGPEKSITLCGFMSCGKSTIGRMLASRLGYTLVDTDTLLLREAGMSLQEIFAKGGETLFRDMEHETIRKVAGMKHAVIATGGGVMTFERNAVLLHDSTFVVHICRPFEDCYQAILRRTNRPIAGQKTREQMEEMYNNRLAAYNRYADYILENTGTAAEAAEQILRRLNVEAQGFPEKEL